MMPDAIEIEWSRNRRSKRFELGRATGQDFEFEKRQNKQMSTWLSSLRNFIKRQVIQANTTRRKTELYRRIPNATTTTFQRVTRILFVDCRYLHGLDGLVIDWSCSVGWSKDKQLTKCLVIEIRPRGKSIRRGSTLIEENPINKTDHTRCLLDIANLLFWIILDH